MHTPNKIQSVVKMFCTCLWCIFFCWLNVNQFTHGTSKFWPPDFLMTSTAGNKTQRTYKTGGTSINKKQLLIHHSDRWPWICSCGIQFCPPETESFQLTRHKLPPTTYPSKKKNLTFQFVMTEVRCAEPWWLVVSQCWPSTWKRSCPWDRWSSFPCCRPPWTPGPQWRWTPVPHLRPPPGCPEKWLSPF